MNKEELTTLPTLQGTSHCSCLEHCFSFCLRRRRGSTGGAGSRTTVSSAPGPAGLWPAAPPPTPAAGSRATAAPASPPSARPRPGCGKTRVRWKCGVLGSDPIISGIITPPPKFASRTHGYGGNRCHVGWSVARTLCSQ